MINVLLIVMKIIKLDVKKDSVIKAESTEDLYTLLQVIKPNDIIGAKTLRTEQNTTKKKKIAIFLKIRVEKTGLSEEGNVLNLSGKIIEAKDIVQKGYHTIHVKPNDVFRIEKKWKGIELTELKQAVKERQINLLIVNLDERSCVVAKGGEKRINPLCSIRKENAGKHYSQADEGKYFEDVFCAIKEHIESANYLIIAGPGFAPADFYKFLKTKKRNFVENLLKNTIVDVTSVVGGSGLNEIISRGILDRVVNNSILCGQTKLVEGAFDCLAKTPHLVTYGKKQVEEAIREKAVESLLISDKIVKDKEIETIVEKAKKIHSEIHIINSHHAAGERLYDMGGIIALLRYRID